MASKNICINSISYIKSLTQENTAAYNKYNKYISKVTNKFVNSQYTLLTNIFNIKNNIAFTISYTETLLTETLLDKNNNIYSIPQFLDIFRYLITLPVFISSFTINEQHILQDKLSLNHTKTQCYDFLNKSTLGTKILSIYNSLK